jgi:histidyl-tRNA synthetase
MKIHGVKGTRDFYPPEMARRNRIVDGWKKVSIRNGFEEYDGPIFEYLQLYQIKSGDEIAEQLFSLTDRGGRDLAIRPEITPTLARMVNEQINSLPRPIKWFSVPRLCRAERPQRGRLREFFQWNIDIIGVDDVLADAEVIFCGLDYLLNEAKLPAQDVVVKISNRKLLHAILTSYGVKDEQLDAIYGVLDKKSKLPPDAFEEMTREKIADQEIAGKVIALSKMSNDEVWKQYITPNLDKDNEFSRAAKEMDQLFEYLKVMRIPESAFEFDMGIIRGLAYYTGVVFEFYDKAGEMRALGGGGRYDNLLELLGGPKISATGLGMGDVVLGIMLEEKGLLKPEMLGRKIDYYIAYTDKVLLSKAIEITANLRQKGFAAEMSYKGGNLGKQLKAATAANAAKCIILGEELAKCNEIIIKDLATGEQTAMAANSFGR